jgi:hypothetical protein
MPKVPKNLNLKPFLGATLNRVEPLENVTYFTFDRPRGWRRRFKGKELQVGVESRWELRDVRGVIVCSGAPIAENTRAEYPIGRKVTGSRVQAPDSFSLQFETGESLEVIDTSDQYESFSIPQENVWV